MRRKMMMGMGTRTIEDEETKTRFECLDGDDLIS